MFFDPTTSGPERIYFNAMLQHSYTGLNPNTALTGGNLLVPGPQFAVAYLGLWRDCNDDGHVGHVESALLEYRAEILLDDGVCPPVDAGADRSVHNDGAWVRELLWIGWANNTANAQARVPGVVHDEDARVWGDDGVPGGSSFVGCSLNPPRGTFASTGGIVAWLDCYGSRGVLDTIDRPLRDAGESTDLDLDFEHEEFPQCSQSALNVPLGLFYRDPRCPSERAGILEPRTDRPAAVVWDCDQQTPVMDLEDRELASVPFPGDVRADPDGSAYDAASHLVGGLEGHCSETGGSTLDGWYVAMHPEQPYVATTVKRESTFAMEFFGDRAGSYLGRVYEDPAMPANAGLAPLNNAGLLPLVGGARLGPAWQSHVTREERPRLLRENLGGEGPTYYTFYASVGPGLRSFAQLPSGLGFYAAEWCGDEFEGIHHGVDCDPEHWWSEEHGASAMPHATWSSTPMGPRPFDPYWLRDVDCYDGQPARNGVPLVGLGLLSDDSPCFGDTTFWS